MDDHIILARFILIKVRAKIGQKLTITNYMPQMTGGSGRQT